MPATLPETRHGVSDLFPVDRVRGFFSLAAEPHRVIGFDSPDLAPVRCDSKIARHDGASTLFYVGDAIGSVHELVDTAGVVQRRVLNTAWGEDLPGFAPLVGPGDRYGFTQREADSESGLQHFRARSYDPRLGRFVQKDPVETYAQHYRYASNSPLNRTDPLGLQDIEFGPGGGPKSGNRRYVSVSETDAEIRFHIKFVVDVQPGVSLATGKAFVERFKRAENLWNAQTHRFAIRGRKAKSVRFTFDATAIDSMAGDRIPADRFRFTLNSTEGRKPGKIASLGRLYVDNKPEDIGHEIGHISGLEEDYRVKGGDVVATRQTIMGAGGTKKVEVRPYHIATWLITHYDELPERDLDTRRSMLIAIRMLGIEDARKALGGDPGQAKQLDAIERLIKEAGIKELQPPIPEKDE